MKRRWNNQSSDPNNFFDPNNLMSATNQNALAKPQHLPSISTPASLLLVNRYGFHLPRLSNLNTSPVEIFSKCYLSSAPVEDITEAFHLAHAFFSANADMESVLKWKDNLTVTPALLELGTRLYEALGMSVDITSAPNYIESFVKSISPRKMILKVSSQDDTLENVAAYLIHIGLISSNTDQQSQLLDDPYFQKIFPAYFYASLLRQADVAYIEAIEAATLFYEERNLPVPPYLLENTQLLSEETFQQMQSTLAVTEQELMKHPEFSYLLQYMNTILPFCDNLQCCYDGYQEYLKMPFLLKLHFTLCNQKIIFLSEDMNACKQTLALSEDINTEFDDVLATLRANASKAHQLLYNKYMLMYPTKMNSAWEENKWLNGKISFIGNRIEFLDEHCKLANNSPEELEMLFKETDSLQNLQTQLCKRSQYLNTADNYFASRTHTIETIKPLFLQYIEVLMEPFLQAVAIANSDTPVNIPMHPFAPAQPAALENDNGQIHQIFPLLEDPNFSVPAFSFIDIGNDNLNGMPSSSSFLGNAMNFTADNNFAQRQPINFQNLIAPASNNPANPTASFCPKTATNPVLQTRSFIKKH